MKRLLSITLTLIMLFGSMIPISAETTDLDVTAAWAEENGWIEDDSGYTKEINDVHYSLFYGFIKSEDYGVDEPQWQISTISSPNATGEVVIPSSVDGIPVTSVGKHTFSYNNNITACHISEGIELIGESVFYNCKNLQTVSLPDTLVMIDLMAFYSTSKLTELTIPFSVEKIARNAFLRNTTTDEGLEKLTFLGDAPKVSYATEESGYALTNLDGVKIYIGPETDGWTQEIWEKYDLNYLEEKLPYIDVRESDWFYESARFNYEKGIMTGLNEVVFGPYEALSRAQFVLMLYRMSGSPDVEYKEVFQDVADETWYTDAIMWANENGIVTGYADGYFGVDRPATREDVVTILYRYVENQGADAVPGGESENNETEDLAVTGGESENNETEDCAITSSALADDFEDSALISTYAREAMNWAIANNIITGKDNGTKLNPQGVTARAEGATMIQRFLKVLE